VTEVVDDRDALPEELCVGVVITEKLGVDDMLVVLTMQSR
jgi:hypothetical protein